MDILEKVDKDMFVFITIGKVWSSIPYQNKVKTLVKKGETLIKVAKQLRKQVAQFNGIKTPSVLSWGVFLDVEQKEPSVCSENWVEHI